MNATTQSVKNQGREIACQLRRRLPIYSLMALQGYEWAFFVDGTHCGGFGYRDGVWAWVPPDGAGSIGCSPLWREEVKAAVLKAIEEVKNEKI